MRTVEAEIVSWTRQYGDDEVRLGGVLCDAHAGAVALRYERGGETTELSYAELSDRSRRLAGALRDLGVDAGDRVAVMLPKSPELLVAVLAIWRAGAVHVPLFTAFGPDAVAYRLARSRPRVAITDADNRPKLDGARGSDMCVLRVGTPPGGEDVDFAEAVRSGAPMDDVARSGEDPFVLLYTSGTTGHPKGVEVSVEALTAIRSYMRHGLDLRPDDVYWNMADPGWAYGLYYGIVGPLLLGQTTLWRAVPFDAEDVFDAVLAHGITNLTGAPTVFRALRAAPMPDGFRARHRLRVISSAGEPLNPELLDWSRRELGLPIHDHYGQSELGMVAYLPHHPELRVEPVPGSMGAAAPGYRVAVLGDDGEELGAREAGELAIDVEGSPQFWFRGYLDDPKRTAERFPHGPRYYLTGDAAQWDEAGMLHFASRADDVITSSGYRIGPFEVESALMAHPAVAEVAVVGTPDELRGEAVTAFVVAAPGVTGDPELAEELRRFVKSRLAKHLYPRHVVFVGELPKTPSGKVRRNVLREQWSAA